VSLRRAVTVATALGVFVPIALLVRTLLLGSLFGSSFDLLSYPGSIFMFNESRQVAILDDDLRIESPIHRRALCIRSDDLVRYLPWHFECMAAFCPARLNL